jgi:hypothetical protein
MEADGELTITAFGLQHHPIIRVERGFAMRARVFPRHENSLLKE